MTILIQHFWTVTSTKITKITKITKLTYNNCYFILAINHFKIGETPRAGIGETPHAGIGETPRAGIGETPCAGIALYFANYTLQKGSVSDF